MSDRVECKTEAKEKAEVKRVLSIISLVSVYKNLPVKDFITGALRQREFFRFFSAPLCLCGEKGGLNSSRLLSLSLLLRLIPTKIFYE